MMSLKLTLDFDNLGQTVKRSFDTYGGRRVMDHAAMDAIEIYFGHTMQTLCQHLNIWVFGTYCPEFILIFEYLNIWVRWLTWQLTHL